MHSLYVLCLITAIGSLMVAWLIAEREVSIVPPGSPCARNDASANITAAGS